MRLGRIRTTERACRMMKEPSVSIFTCFCVLLLVLPAARAQGSYGFPQQPSGSAPPPPPPPPYDYRSQPQHMPGGQYFPYESAQQGRAPPTPPHMMQPQFPGQAKPYEAQKPGESIWQRIGQRLFQGDGAHQPPPRRPPQYTGVPHSMSHQQRPLPPQNRMVPPHRMGAPYQHPESDDGNLLSKGLKWLGLSDDQPGAQGPGPFGGRYPQQQPQQPQQQQQQQQQQYQQAPAGYQSFQPHAQPQMPHQQGSVPGPYPPLPLASYPSQSFQQQQPLSGAQPSFDEYGQPGNYPPHLQQPPMFGAQDSYMSQQQQHQQSLPQQQQPQPPTPYIPEGPGTPEMYVVDDNVVFIMRPNDFYRKKQEFVRAGPQSVQVFANFEKTFTKFKAPNGQPALSTEVLLENSAFLLPQAAAKIRQLKEEYAQQGYMDDTSHEELAAKIHQVIAVEGGMHFGGIAPMVREQLMNIPLREGWNDVLGKLAWSNIPLYMFSSGYGDVVAQVMSQNDATAMAANMRVISNSFRLTPDGSVRGFTMPVVHERNKNATTAARVMELPLTHRPNVLVLGTEEQDLSLSSGTIVNEQISVAYLDMTEDLSAKLPRYFELFDVVIVGDGSMTFISQLINELVGGPQ